MTDDENPDDWAPPSPITPSAPSEWSPPSAPNSGPPVMGATGGSSLPAPPPAPRVAVPPTAASISTGPIAAASVGAPRWAGRAVALGAAVMLIGGGGYLALNASSSDGGAESPADALEGALIAIAEEDLIGAAEFVEPTERETMIAAGFEVVDELIRLEVFDDSLDLSSVNGIDIDFGGLEFDVVEIRPDLAHIFIERGSYVTGVDGSALPFGPLVTDRVGPEVLATSETTGGQMITRESPVVAVNRDGRWYLSLWYSVAENARLELDEQLPSSADRVTAIGADSPERAITNLVGALEHGDLATSIGMLDPQEMSALYDYAPLFLDDAQDTVDQLFVDLRESGWSWSVDNLALSSTTDGSVAMVTIDAFSFSANGPDDSRIALTFSDGNSTVEARDEYGGFTAETIDGCTTYTDDDTPTGDTVCADELSEGLGLQGLFTGGLGELGSTNTAIILREVDGRWYVSPIRTGSAALIGMLKGFDAESLASTVDGVADLLLDPFATLPMLPQFADDSETMLFDTADEPFVLPVEAGNIGLLPDWDWQWTQDLTLDPENGDWYGWLSSATPMDADRGVVAGLEGDDGISWFEITAVSGLNLADDAALAEMLDAAIVTTNDRVYLSGDSDWGPFVAARYNDGFVLVGDSNNESVSPDAFDLLIQVLDS